MTFFFTCTDVLFFFFTYEARHFRRGMSFFAAVCELISVTGMSIALALK